MAAAATAEAAKLPHAVQELLQEIVDPPLRDGLEHVFQTAARVIKGLRNFELIRYEGQSADVGADLQLFEEIAPVLMATVTEINSLVQSVETSFPEGFKPDSGGASEAQRAERAVEILRERTLGFRADVLQLGAQLRTPQAVSDRWNLLGHLQSARGKLRFGIGEMLTDVANVFGEFSNKQVVPEYELDVEHALLLRRSLAKLATGLRAHHERLLGAKPAEVPPLVARLHEVLDRLAKTQTWFELRAPDKREFIRFREEVASLEKRGCPPDETRRLVEGFLRFLELLTSILNQRAILQNQDRGCIAEITAALERADGAAPADAKESLAEAFALCERLAGRDPELDKYVASAKNSPALVAAEGIATLREHALRLLVAG